MANRSRIINSTSYPDINTADKHTWEALRRNAGALARWLKDDKFKKQSFTAELNEVVGYGFGRAGKYSDSITSVKVMLVRDEDKFAVVSSYPIIENIQLIENEKLLDLSALNCLLMYLSPEFRLDDDHRNDVQIIFDVLSDHSEHAIQDMLDECRKVLAMEPFPWEWVQSMTESCVYDVETEQWVEDNPVLYHKWLNGIVDFLEEARRLGKLTSNSGA